MDRAGPTGNPDHRGVSAAPELRLESHRSSVGGRPFWSVASPSTANPCDDDARASARFHDMELMQRDLADIAAAVRQVALPTTRFWVNFSKPEILWMRAGNCPFRLAVRTSADGISTARTDSRHVSRARVESRQLADRGVLGPAVFRLRASDERQLHIADRQNGRDEAF